MHLGFLETIIKSFTYTPIYSYLSPTFLFQTSFRPLHMLKVFILSCLIISGTRLHQIFRQRVAYCPILRPTEVLSLPLSCQLSFSTLDGLGLSLCDVYFFLTPGYPIRLTTLTFFVLHLIPILTSPVPSLLHFSGDEFSSR